MPPKVADKEIKQAALVNIRTYLHRHRDWHFQDLAKGQWCENHGKECPVHPSASPHWSAKARTSTPLWVCSGSVCCQGWSSVGLQEQGGHATDPPLHVFLQERRARMLQLMGDICFIECMPPIWAYIERHIKLISVGVDFGVFDVALDAPLRGAI